MLSITVIICTIRRVELLNRLLRDLAKQSYRNVDVLVVGPAQWSTFPPTPPNDVRGLTVSFLPAPKGLSKARNLGLEHAKGSLVCFLDDDVRLETDFLEKAALLFSQRELADVGGLTGYDTVHYSTPVSVRWKLRHLLGVIPSLEPGDVDHLGSNVPLAFLSPFSGCREVKWLPGFCQIFRRSAISGLCYDEVTAAEDRDFSMEVGRRWRLLVCGDLRLAHEQDSQDRMDTVASVRRAAFGLGRSFVKRKRGPSDNFRITRIVLGDLLIDVLAAVMNPSSTSWKTSLSRLQGYLSGIASLRTASALEHD
jgi:glycosyltransferase involved in cell wall biosynthesis